MSEKKRLSIRLLGPPKLLWDGKPLVIKRRMVRILIYYLACKKIMVGRTDILLTFWPDDPNSRRNLRDLLSKLRSELPDQNFIKTDRDWVGLDFDSVYVDVIEFEDLYKQLTLPFLSVENRPLPEAIYQKMLHAINLWESPNFMAGSGALDSEGLEDWLHQQTSLLHGHRLDLTMRVCLHLINAGELESALDWLSRLISEDEDYEYPLAVYSKIDVLYRLQRYAQAHEYGREVLEEMGPEWFSGYARPLKLLMEQIETVRKRSPIVVSEQPPVQNSNRIPFTGQKDALFQIQKAYHRGGVLVLSGESGIGKTRILQEFLNDAEPAIRVFRMKAKILDQKLGFQTIADMLRQDLLETDWQALEPFWGKQLATILPEINQLWTSQSAIDRLIDNKKINQLEAFHQLFLKLAQNQKLILVLDNAQWCDEESLSVLTYLIQRDFFSDHTFLVLSLRLDETDGLLWNLMQEKNRLEGITTLEISPLTNEDISSLSFSVLGKKISKELLGKIKDASGGNALFIIETLRTLIESDLSPDHLENQDLPLSGTIHAAILDRIKRLTPAEFQVLSFASVLRNKFAFDHLQKALEMDALILADILENLENYGLIQVGSAVHRPAVYKFKHLFVKQVCAMEIASTKKQLIHLRIARALQNNYEKKPTKELYAQAAYHFAEAGEAITAFNLWIKVANYPQTMVEKPTPFEAYQNAQQIIFHQNFELSIQQVYDLFVGWGNLALLKDELEIAKDCFTKVTIDGQRRHDDFLVGCGYSGMAFLYSIHGLPETAMQYATRAIGLIQPDHLEEYIRVRNRKAMINIQQALLPEAVEELSAIQQYLDSIHTIEGLNVIIESKYFLALSYLLIGNFSLAYKQAMSAYQILKDEKFDLFQVEIEIILGLIAFKRGNNSEALKYFGETLQLAELKSTWRFVLQALTYSCFTNIQMGRIFHSLENIQNGLQLSDIYNNYENQSYLLNAKAKIYLLFQNYELANKYFNEAIHQSKGKYQIVLQQHDIGLTQCLMGDFDTGSFTLREAIQSAELYGFKSIELETRIHLALMAYLKGIRQSNLTIIQQLTLQTTQLEMAGAGSALMVLEALEALENNQPEVIMKSIQDLTKLALKEENIWLEWHAHELQIKLANLQKMDTREFEFLKADCINRIKQTVPKQMLKEIQFKSPPFSILV